MRDGSNRVKLSKLFNLFIEERVYSILIRENMIGNDLLRSHCANILVHILYDISIY